MPCPVPCPLPAPPTIAAETHVQPQVRAAVNPLQAVAQKPHEVPLLVGGHASVDRGMLEAGQQEGRVAGVQQPSKPLKCR